jgi:hypothetical protein
MSNEERLGRKKRKEKEKEKNVTYATSMEGF